MSNIHFVVLKNVRMCRVPPLRLLVTGTCMWSGGISGRNRVRPAEKWAQDLTCQTAEPPACHIQFVMRSFFLFMKYIIVALLIQSAYSIILYIPKCHQVGSQEPYKLY